MREDDMRIVSVSDSSLNVAICMKPSVIMYDIRA